MLQYLQYASGTEPPTERQNAGSTTSRLQFQQARQNREEVEPNLFEQHRLQIQNQANEDQNWPGLHQNQQMEQNRMNGIKHWLGLAQGVVKINCDAAWNSITSQGGIGVVARNHEG